MFYFLKKMDEYTKFSWVLDFCIPLILWILILIITVWVDNYITSFYEGIVLLLLCNILYQLMKTKSLGG